MNKLVDGKIEKMTEKEIAELKSLQEVDPKNEALKEINRLESLMTPRRYRELGMGTEETVGVNGTYAKTGVPFSQWVQSKIDEQVAILKS